MMPDKTDIRTKDFLKFTSVIATLCLYVNSEHPCYIFTDKDHLGGCSDTTFESISIWISTRQFFRLCLVLTDGRQFVFWGKGDIS
jgi:hypothetical protein